MDEPVLSICLITYNHQKFIKDAIEGVLDQKVNFTWKLIIADDYSTDGTREILLDYKEKYPDVIHLIFQEKNVGAERNWIELMAYPKSKYIAYFEGDDHWTNPLKLQKQIDFLENNPDYSLICHNAMVNNLFDGTQKLFNTKFEKNTFTTKDLILKSWFVPSASIVFRNENFKLPRWSNVNGDLTMLLINSLNGKIFYIDEVMSVYNFATSSSASQGLLSQNKAKRLFRMYNNKFRLLNQFDKYTNFKFVVYTSVKRLKMLGGLTLQLLK